MPVPFDSIPVFSSAREALSSLIAASASDRFELYSDWGLFWFRLVVGIIFLVHGIQKLHFWRVNYTGAVPKTTLVLFRIAGLIETVCALGLIVGIFTNVLTLLLIGIMLGALYYKIVIWHKHFTGEGGWEFDLLVLVSLFLLFFLGAGRLSYDRSLFGV